MEIKPFIQQVYAGKQPAHLVGYDGISPGPTFIVPRGTETFVRILNNAQIETSVHLHGSPSRAPFDGWAEDVTNPGQYKDYYWPNNQNARFLWYHDHAMHFVSSLSRTWVVTHADQGRQLKMPTSAKLVATLSMTPLKTHSAFPPDTGNSISHWHLHPNSTMQMEL